VATKEKNAAEERMAVVQARLDESQKQFDAAMAQKQVLEEDAAACQKKMDGAAALLHALAGVLALRGRGVGAHRLAGRPVVVRVAARCRGRPRCTFDATPRHTTTPARTGEESRWTAQSKEFDAQIQRLTGDCAVASAFVSYLGPFNKEFRELLMTRDFYGDCLRLGIPVTQNIEVHVWWGWTACVCFPASQALSSQPSMQPSVARTGRLCNTLARLSGRSPF
jgi:dynein heavy chain